MRYLLLASFLLAPLAWLPETWAPWAAVSLVYLVTSLMTETITNNATPMILTRWPSASPTN